jgi:hypothetical protein
MGECCGRCGCCGRSDRFTGLAGERTLASLLTREMPGSAPAARAVGCFDFGQLRVMLESRSGSMTRSSCVRGQCPGHSFAAQSD